MGSGRYSENSLDQDREATNTGSTAFTNDNSPKDDKTILANRVLMEDVLIGDIDHKTRLLKRIGGGSFGEIYLAELVDTKQKVAVKIEPMSGVLQFLLHEGDVYRKLEAAGVVGLPRVHWYGLHGSEYSMMVMDLLGKTLYQLWVECEQSFSMKTILMLADQMLTVVQQTHCNGFVHRDISPSNVMMGLNEKRDQVHLIDYGHAKKIATNLVVVPASSRRRVSLRRPMVGTPRFASVFTHMGQEEGYRDDLESLGYIWIYLIKGRLPWQGQRLYAGENKLDRIAYIKLNTRLESLCEGLPEEFLVYMNYVRRLRSTELPDHDQIKGLFRNLGGALKIEYDWKFDWLEKESRLSASEDSVE